jgi:hypothetical protein
MTVRKWLSAALLLLALPLSFAQAQETASIYYLGRSDSNQDGFVDFSDAVTLYAGSTAISAQTANVVSFSVNAQAGKVAYISQAETGGTLTVLDTASGQSLDIPVADITPFQVDIFEDYVWIVGHNAEQIPVLRGFSAADGQAAGEYVFRSPESNITLHSSGDWALAYNSVTGGLSVLSLPNPTLVLVELSGYLLSTPVWSPTQPHFAVALGNVDNPGEVGLFVIDVSVPQSNNIHTIPIGSNGQVITQWSTEGQYISYSAEDESMGVVTPLTIVEATTGTAQPLTKEGVNLNVVEWSAADTFALITEQTIQAEDQITTFSLYNSADAQLTPVGLLATLEVTSVSWSSGAPQLAVMGRSTLDGEYSLNIFDPLTNNVTGLFESTDPDVSSTLLYWMPDNARIVFSAPSYDTIITNGGSPTALFVVDILGVAERVSPEGVQVDRLSVQIG